MTRAILIFLLLIPAVGYADMYSWTDENGVRHFSNTPPKDSSSPIQQREEVYSRANNETPGKEKAPSENTAAPKKKETKTTKPKPAGIPEGTDGVRMYATSTCGYCMRARNFFKKNKIAYTEYDIIASAEARKQYEYLNGRGVPLIFVGEQRISGFNEAALKKALGLD